MFLTVSWGILTLGKIARAMFCIIKSDYVVSCYSFSINREKLGDYLKWTDYSKCFIEQDALIYPFHTAYFVNHYLHNYEGGGVSSVVMACAFYHFLCDLMFHYSMG